jgi:hypothetical protein
MAKTRTVKLTSAVKEKDPAKKSAVAKPARSGKTHVQFGMHGLTNIVNRVREAGLESEFNKKLAKDDKFVSVQRKSLATIKNFVESKPQLADLASEMNNCDCPPDDHYCIYI